MTARPSPTSFAALLRRHRIQANLSQEALAERSRLSVRGISDLERGARRQPRRDTVRLLAEALRLSTRDRRLFEDAARRHHAPGHGHGDLGWPATPLLERSADLAELVRLVLDETAPLLTVTGPPGVGKTRLAHQLVREARVHLDHTATVLLAGVSAPALLPRAIGEALGGSGQETAEDLVQMLAGSRTLILLDGFDALLSAAPLLLRIVASCPETRIVVTSCAALAVRAERRHAVVPLSLPSPLRGVACGSVDLFAHHAAAVRSGFRLTPANAPAVAELCRRLDGIPLAIELAAARARVLTPETILARMGRPLDLLTRGTRDAPDHHRSLRDTLDITWALLDGGQRALYRRLAVFAAGYGLADVEEVAASDGACRDPLHDLGVLLDHNLVVHRQSGDGEPRFGMHGVIRAHALERLDASAEGPALRRRHALRTLLAADGDGPAASPAVSLDDLLSAARWAVTASEHDLAARLLWATARRWDAAGAPPPRGAAAAVLLTAAEAAKAAADPEAAAALAVEALWLTHAAGDAVAAGRALTVLREAYGTAAAMQAQTAGA